MLRETHQCGESDLPRGDISRACRALEHREGRNGHRTACRVSIVLCVRACRREFGLVGGRRPRQNAEECCGEKVGSSRASGRWSPPLCVLYLSRLYNKMRRAHRPAFFSPFAQNIVHLHAMRCVSHGSRRSLCTLSITFTG